MDIIWRPTLNFGYPTGARGRKGEQIVGIVDHIMEATETQYLNWIAGPANGAENSATFSVGRDGRVYQHVRLEDAHWCNGPMARPDLSVPWIRRCFEQHVNPNLVTVSIEHEGYTGRPLTAAQIEATIALHNHIIERCPGIKRDRTGIVGHYQIDAVNKSRCPGSAFPWGQVLEGVQGMTDKERLAIGEYAGAVWDANARISAILNEVDAALPLPVVRAVLARIRVEQGVIHDNGVAGIKKLAGLG